MRSSGVVVTVLLLIGVLGLIMGCTLLQNSPPVAIFTCDPSSGISSLMVSFSAWDSYDSDGRIVSYEWDFGDGDTDTGIFAIHTYAVSAYTQFTVRLTVTDDSGASSSRTRTVTVSPALQILDWQLVNDGSSFWPWSVLGHAKNISGKTLDYAEVRVRFYDASNVLLDSGIDNVTDLPTETVWEFEERCTNNDVTDRVHHAEVEIGDCHIWSW